jgi:hypothetical protein
MLAVIVLNCECGAKVKVMYDTGHKTTVRCPKGLCKTNHVVPGQITHLWLEGHDQLWKALDVAPLLVSTK